VLDSYFHESNVGARQDMLNVLARMRKGSYREDVIAFLQGECLRTEGALRLGAVHALGQVASREGTKDGNSSATEAVCLRVLAAVANEAGPFSPARREAGEYLYELGRGELIPRELRERLLKGPQK